MSTPSEIKYTPEQLAAAKARARGAETEDQWVVLNKAGGGEVSDNACAILLAALEATEADSARLDWLEAHKGLRPGNCDRDAQSYYILHVPSGYDYYKGGKNLPLREAIESARKAQS